MTDDELEEWLEGYLTRNPGKRAMIEGSFTVSPRLKLAVRQSNACNERTTPRRKADG
jgi:hypothetical protein